MKRLLPFIKLLSPHRNWAYLALFAGIITLITSIGLLAVSGWFISAAAVAGLSMAATQAFNLHTPSASIRGFALIRTLARYAERVVSHETTLRLLSSLRVWFYQKIEPQAPSNLYRYRSGDLLSRIVGDIDILDSLFVRVLSPTISALIVAIVLGGMLWWLAPVLSLVFFGLFLFAGIVTPISVGWTSRRMAAKIQKQQALLRSNLVEDLSGMADLLIYGAQAQHTRDRLAESDRLLRLQEKMAVISGASTAILSFMGGLATLTALYVALPIAQSGAFSEPVLAFIAFGVLAAFETLQPLPLAYQMMGKIMEAAERLLQVSEAPAAVVFPDKPAPRSSASTITFVNISFTYPGSKEAVALKSINFTIAPESTVALVGPSGSGKTTLAHLLTRFWDPDQGSILVGDTDLKTLNEAQLRSMITMVSQKGHIFNRTLRKNLLIAAPEAEEAQLQEAIEKAQLSHFVASLPEGLDTWVGEAGSQLSGGEARRLILARALLKNSPVWILDEPTEGLDNRTRRRFTETLFDNLAGRTGLFITHTPEALAQVDRVCFLENGQVSGYGSHKQLLADNPRYRHFIGSQ
ncbi:MAG: thiol reductant ABC exporter subunit CydC [Desulfobulbaceae bacterium]|nr:MAG: thiol reductant ABC exporter subunit CydC [Desulfobulbaceae bacterium]